MRKFSLVVLLSCGLALAGCSTQQKALDVYNVLEGIVAVAQAEAVNVPAADQPTYNSLVALAGTLDDQLHVCITASGTKSAKLLACFNSYASGLASPTELAQLRILSPATQKKVQLYVSSIVAGVNVAVRFFGGSQVATPSVAPAPTKAEMRELADRIGYEGEL